MPTQESSARAGKCRPDSGLVIPLVDPQRCEGKGACVTVCPYNVFRVGPMEEAQYRSMPALVRFKLWVHGKKTATTPKASDCHACGLCVGACPENAIRLVKASSRATQNAG